ncbi:TadE family type IV pilus minor pilin [Saccharothrix australiensis]|uniref:TadE-like protein n=1 Tax=Saccharothrix australiensis TaxID=2072 RepID=A0A495VWQ9_9PSEU|nr:hypothetical protein C8E97_0639 [Saccharothrix australiensis]
MTVEAALALCGVLVFVALGAEVVMTVVGQLRCTDAAREAARLVARGDSARVSSAVAAIAPAGAEVVVRREGDTAWAEVTSRRGLVDVRARAYAVLEFGVTDEGRPSPVPGGERWSGKGSEEESSGADRAVPGGEPPPEVVADGG